MNPAQQQNPAEIYDGYFVPAMFLPWARVLLGHAAPQAGERVLDLACGTGAVARSAAALVGDGGMVAALDVNPAMLAVARALPPPAGATITWHEGNAMAQPFPDAAFDLVLCQHGLQFFPQRDGAVSEMRRVLAPHGRALVIVLQALALHPVFEALMESVARQLALPITAVATPFALSDADALRALFETGGFGTVEIVDASTEVRFAHPERFVPLAVASSAAAVPAFAQMLPPERAALMDAVRAEVEPILHGFRDAEAIRFPMFAHVVVATA